MGRKKIEIRPLTDERNRNVTFLKRKAGLMKKAWELSVLCGADVSILIFSNVGKAYEFSSKDLDEEMDRYLDYEGMIERRRAEEFAAMAAAGDDDDDDEDETPIRRGSTARQSNGVSAPAPIKSLKGRETYKARMSSRAGMARAYDGGKKGKGRKRKSREIRRGFVEGILSDGEEDGDGEDEKPGSSIMVDSSAMGSPEDEIRQRRGEGSHGPRGSPRSQPPDVAGLQYALNLHTIPQSQSHQHSHTPQLPMIIPSLPHLPSDSYPSPWRPPMQSPYPQPSHTYGYPSQQQSYYSSQSTPTQQPPLLPNGMQWDPNLLARYAEYQLQQNHQKQQRALLERQRIQLAELGIPVEDKSLLDQLFGGPATQPQPQSQSQSHVQAQSQGNNLSESYAGEEAFEWPTFGQSGNGHHPGGGGGHGGQHGQSSGQGQGRGYEEDNVNWPFGEDSGSLHSPAILERGSEGMSMKKRDEVDGGGGGAHGEKRNRVS